MRKCKQKGPFWIKYLIYTLYYTINTFLKWSCQLQIHHWLPIMEKVCPKQYKEKCNVQNADFKF